MSYTERCVDTLLCGLSSSVLLGLMTRFVCLADPRLGGDLLWLCRTLTGS